MNAVEVYEDEIMEYNPILGKLRFTEDFSKCVQRKEGNQDKIAGYYAYYELLAGFAKGLYMTKEEVINHAKRYSVAYQRGRKDTPWFTNFNEMAKKTVIKRLLSKWGILSVEMQKAVTEDQKVYEADGEGEYRDNEPEKSPADELAKEVADKMAGRPKKAKEKLIEAPAESPAAEEDYARFDAEFEDFMNAPAGEQEELPFA